MKLNQKGYMMVELVLSSVLAMTIAIYLLNLTIQFKNKNEDIYQSIGYSADKIETTKNIMNDLENLTITEITVQDNNVDLDVIEKNNVASHRKLTITNVNQTITITYGKYKNNTFDQNDVSYYQKTLQKSLLFKSIDINNSNENTVTIEINLESMYTNEDYSIKLLASATGKLLASKNIGDYVNYIGSNGCEGAACRGQNANYVNDTNMGYCRGSSSKFNANGWRIAYIKEATVYLISAGSPECMCTDSNGMSATSCSDYEGTTGTPRHLRNLNKRALAYCNTAFAYNGICNSSTARNMNDTDFKIITGDDLKTAYGKSEKAYSQYAIIDVGSYYWFATNYNSGITAYFWSNIYQNVRYKNTNFAYGIRPILRLRSSVKVISGTGTYQDPYIIN